MRDQRTMRLAQLQITKERVDAVVAYQRTVAQHLGEPGHEGWAGHLAFAHAAGLKASGLDAQDARKLSAVAADFCGRRLQVKRLEQRLADAKAKIAAAKATKKDADLAAKIPAELLRVGDFSVFTGLHGPEALANLQAREAELLELHEKLAHLEGEGHLHRA
jgi:hypothetical protein